MGRCLLVLVLSLVVGAAEAKPGKSKPPPADPAPPAVDVSAVLDALELYHDGKGHYMATVHPRQPLPKYVSFKSYMFYGDGKVFYRIPVPSASRDKDNYSVLVADPRVPWGQARFSYKAGVAEFSCEKRKITLSKLDPVKETALVKKAKFLDRFWHRSPHALTRDDDGTYYYVDQLWGSDELTRTPQGLRVFVGQRGRLRFLPMKNLVVDPAGEIFITADGRLKLLVDYSSKNAVKNATWITGKDRRSLTVVPLQGSSEFRSRLFIYRELGVYAGITMHMPCDDW